MTLSNLFVRHLRQLALALGILALAVFSDSFLKPEKRASVVPPSVRNVMAIYGADAQGVDRGSRDYMALDQVEWKRRPGATNQTAVIFGDPSKPGMYVQLLKRGPDDWSQPHSHPNDRYLTVLAGTMLIGTGAKFDRNNTVALGPGGMVKDVAGQMHYDGTGPEGVTIEIIGIGPTARIESDGKGSQ